jgi:hypothetical protein
MELPYQLANGIHLERSNVVLPWGASVERLAGIGSPEVHRHKSGTTLLWHGEQVFGGLPVQVGLLPGAGLDAFYLQTSSELSARLEYARLLVDLSGRLGSPHLSVVDDGYPWARWTWGDVRVSLRVAERFTEYVAFMVSRGIK